MGNPHHPTPPPLNGPQLIEILRHLSNTMEARMEMMNHQTTIIRAKYTLLLDKGFTEPQAIYLCTQDWSNCL